MRGFDALYLTKVEPMTAEQIAAPRKREGVSQNVFARYLNVGKKACWRLGTWAEDAVRAISEAALHREAARA